MGLNELTGRFFLLIFSILILFFFSNRKDNQTINPLIVVVGLCTFSLCYLFTKVEIGIGIGFGLFAIFSILRFRAQTFSLNAIIFLFATITLSILDIMYPYEKLELLLFFQVIIIGFYVLAVHNFNRKAMRFPNSIDLKIPYDASFSMEDAQMRKVISEKLRIDKFDFKIIAINMLSDEIEIKVFY
ncbi:MAG: DUF4956 domain-containing protein [Phycisphaerales bacterium]